MRTLLFFALFSTWACAQTTPAELRKAKAEYTRADAALNAAYKAALAALDKAGQQKLRADQREWIGYRDLMAKAQPRQVGDDPEKPEASAAYWDMMAGQSEDRTEWLGSYTKALPPGLTGEWSDSHGGHLYLEERKDGVAFGIETVRTPASNVGGIAGLAKKSGPGAHFTEKVPADEKRPPCQLTFTLSAGGDLEVKGENTDPFHGHNAYFDGTYRKVGKLKKPVSIDHAPNDEEGR